MTNHKYTLQILFFFIGNLVFGQNESWSLNKCIEKAWDSNLTIQMEKNNTLMQQFNKKSDFLSLLPSLNTNHRAGYDYGRSIDEDNNITFDPKYSTQHSLNSSVILFRGFSNLNFYRASSYFYKASLTYQEFIKKKVALDVTKAWFDLLLQKSLTEVADERVKTAEKQLDYIKTLVSIGKLEMAAIMDAEAALSFAKVEFQKTDNQKKLLSMDLQQLMELDYDDNFHENLNLGDVSMPQKITPDVDSLYTLACLNFERIQLLEMEVQAYKFNLKAQKGRFAPTLSATASLSTAYFNNTAVAETPSYINQVENKLNTYFGININIPIFNGLSQNYNVKTTALVYDNATLKLEQEKRLVRKEIENSILNLNAAYSEYQASMQNVSYSKRAYETMMERYQLGVANITDLMVSEDRYLLSKVTLLSNTYKWIVQQKLIEFYIGM